MELPYDPAIQLLGIYPKNSISSYKGICSSMFITVQLTIFKKWKHTGSPSIDKWIKKIWYVSTMVYHSDVRKMKFAGT